MYNNFDDWWSQQERADPTNPITPRMAFNAALILSENICAVAEFNGKGANYCANKIMSIRLSKGN